MHGDVIKWKHFPRYWQFVRGIHRSPVTSPRKGQWRGALLLSLIYVRISGSINNGDAGDLIRHRANYDVIVMLTDACSMFQWKLWGILTLAQDEDNTEHKISVRYRPTSNINTAYPTTLIFSFRLAVVFAHSIEAKYSVENEDVVGAAPKGDAPTTSEWPTIWMPTKARLILEVLRYILSYVWQSINETLDHFRYDIHLMQVLCFIQWKCYVVRVVQTRHHPIVCMWHNSLLHSLIKLLNISN